MCSWLGSYLRAAPSSHGFESGGSGAPSTAVRPHTWTSSCRGRRSAPCPGPGGLALRQGRVGCLARCAGRLARSWQRAVKLITGAGAALLGRVLALDGLEGRWTQIPLVTDTTRSSSPLPSEDDLEDRCGVGAGGRGVTGLDLCVATLTAHQLKDRLADRAAGGEALLLVDVRDPESGPSWRSRAPCRATCRDPGQQRPRGHPPRPTGRALLPQRGAL